MSTPAQKAAFKKGGYYELPKMIELLDRWLKDATPQDVGHLIAFIVQKYVQ